MPRLPGDERAAVVLHLREEAARLLALADDIERGGRENLPQLVAEGSRAADAPALDKTDIVILAALSRSRWPMRQDQISSDTSPRLSVRTIGPRLAKLRDAGLTRRPMGERGGDEITDAGRAALAAFTSD